ncbi:MAG TPA: helix-turn-helix transcriptional regulator, partial [Candidatus Angelobacter sp.]
MGSFGERLRREREMRGITLDEIAESTKISRRHLESLEKEDFDALPGGIFNRGFVRSYARYLGIDEDQAAADYAAAAAEPAETGEKFPLAVPEPDPELNPRRSTLPLILALIALVAVLAIFWARNRSRSGESQEPAAGTAAAGTNTARSPAPMSPTETPPAALVVPEPEFRNSPAPVRAGSV